MWVGVVSIYIIDVKFFTYVVGSYKLGLGFLVGKERRGLVNFFFKV